MISAAGNTRRPAIVRVIPETQDRPVRATALPAQLPMHVGERPTRDRVSVEVSH